MDPWPNGSARLPSIRNVVFDVGQVLIDFSYQDLLAHLHRRGLRYETRAELLERMDLYRYERGEITSEVFLTNVNAMLAEPMDLEELRARWLRVFFPIPAMIDLARQLTVTHRVYLLSNAGQLHWDHLVAHYRINHIGHGQLASFQVGVRKPDASIYRKAEQQFSLIPAQTLFIDDLAENAEGARACGWHAIHHISPAATRRLVCKLCGAPESP